LVYINNDANIAFWPSFVATILAMIFAIPRVHGVAALDATVQNGGNYDPISSKSSGLLQTHTDLERKNLVPFALGKQPRWTLSEIARCPKKRSQLDSKIQCDFQNIALHAIGDSAMMFSR
jgi:hypothetical protein